MKKREDIPLEINGIDLEGYSVEPQDENTVATDSLESDSNDATGGDDTEENCTNADKTKKKKKKRAVEPNNDEDEAAEKSILQQLREFVGEEDQPLHLNIQGILRADGLGHLLARNWLFIVVIVFFTCLYVTSRYMMESAVLENNALTDTLLDRRYKALTVSSQLMEGTLSSHIEDQLQDSTIHMATDQAFTLPGAN